MSKLVAVQGCTIEYETDPANVSLSLTASISLANAKASSGGNKVHKEKIRITISTGTITLTSVPTGASSATSIGMVGGTIDINGTSDKSITEGDVFVLEEDEGDNTFVFNFPPSEGSSPIPEDVKITAKVTNAGQSVLKVT